MGVMTCYRSECDHIMCDRYSNEYGYICDECFDELVQTGITNIHDFMNSRPVRNQREAVEAYYNEIFHKREW